jgi:hypothetical protein
MPAHSPSHPLQEKISGHKTRVLWFLPQETPQDKRTSFLSSKITILVFFIDKIVHYPLGKSKNQRKQNTTGGRSYVMQSDDLIPPPANILQEPPATIELNR